MRPFKLVFLLPVCLIISACAEGGRAATNTPDIQVRCIEGVEYYFFREWRAYKGYGYMSPKYDRSGSVSLCTGAP